MFKSKSGTSKAVWKNDYNFIEKMSQIERNIQPKDNNCGDMEYDQDEKQREDVDLDNVAVMQKNVELDNESNEGGELVEVEELNQNMLIDIGNDYYLALADVVQQQVLSPKEQNTTPKKDSDCRPVNAVTPSKRDSSFFDDESTNNLTDTSNNSRLENKVKSYKKNMTLYKNRCVALEDGVKEYLKQIKDLTDTIELINSTHDNKIETMKTEYAAEKQKMQGIIADFMFKADSTAREHLAEKQAMQNVNSDLEHRIEVYEKERIQNDISHEETKKTLEKYLLFIINLSKSLNVDAAKQDHKIFCAPQELVQEKITANIIKRKAVDDTEENFKKQKCSNSKKTAAIEQSLLKKIEDLDEISSSDEDEKNDTTKINNVSIRTSTLERLLAFAENGTTRSFTKEALKSLIGLRFFEYFSATGKIGHIKRPIIPSWIKDMIKCIFTMKKQDVMYDDTVLHALIDEIIETECSNAGKKLKLSGKAEKEADRMLKEMCSSFLNDC